MKNLLVYLNPSKKFNREHSILVKIQIDNSLELGWKREDIMLVTNFEYEYNGVKSIVVDDNNYCSFRPLSTKTVTVTHLLEWGRIEKDKVYWVHDFDAYQLEPLEMDLDIKDVGFTTYGYLRKWSLGSYFFKDSAKDVFGWLRNAIYKLKTEDERALVELTKDNFNNINSRYKKLNITYNFGMRNVGFNYAIAIKPLKVIHFHPWGKDLPTLDIFMRGKNGIGIPLMTDRLIKLFNKYGIN